MAVLHLGEDRCFSQPAAQINGEQPENTADEERNAPCVTGKFFRRENPVDGGRDQRADHDAERQARAQETTRHANTISGNMLRHKGPCTRNFTANSSALQHAEDDQQDRRANTKRCIGWQAGHGQCRDRHQKHRESEDALAAKLVAKMRQHDAANRAHQIAGCENTESLDQHQPVRHVRRKKQMSDNAREKYEDDKIIKLQRAAKGRKAERAEILPI
ncbi:hypothetical protein D3C80_716730 [compost metagenome]